MVADIERKEIYRREYEPVVIEDSGQKPVCLIGRQVITVVRTEGLEVSFYVTRQVEASDFDPAMTDSIEVTYPMLFAMMVELGQASIRDGFSQERRTDV